MEQEHRSTEFAVGTRLLDRYEVVETIGRGGYGVVYKARQVSTNLLVAIKTLHVDRDRGPAFAERELARFEREKELTRRLKNPNAVRLMDWGEVDGRLLLVLEYVEGIELSERLKRGPLGPRLTRRVMGQVLEVMAEAHHQGILHRDLKPSNIMLVGSKRRPHAKVLDFGIAGMTPEHRGEDWVTLTGRREIRGTPAYMSPEQVFGEAYPESDVYALGLILLECLTGEVAMQGGNPAAVMRMQVEKSVRIPEHVLNGPFGSIIQRATAKKHEQRYKTAEQMLMDFEEAVFPNGIPNNWDLSTDSMSWSREELEALAAEVSSGDNPVPASEFWAGPTLDSGDLDVQSDEIYTSGNFRSLETMPSGEIRLADDFPQPDVTRTTGDVYAETASPRRRLLIVMALLLLGGGIVAAYLLGRDASKEPASQPAAELQPESEQPGVEIIGRFARYAAFRLQMTTGPGTVKSGMGVSRRLTKVEVTKISQPTAMLDPDEQLGHQDMLPTGDEKPTQPDPSDPVTTPQNTAPNPTTTTTPKTTTPKTTTPTIDKRILVWDLASTPPAEVMGGGRMLCGKTPCTVTFRAHEKPSELTFEASGHRPKTVPLPANGGDVSVKLSQLPSTTILD